MPAPAVAALAVGVFGDLDADERIHAFEGDCYSAFHALSALMGHLSSARAGDAATGLWSMNDAGGPWLGGDSAGRRGQFQVDPDGEGMLPLPIEPFTATATAALERFGALTLHGLEYYLPLSVGGPASRRIAAGHEWFTLASPETRTPLKITIDGGESSEVADRRRALVEALNVVSPSSEGLEASLLDDAASVDFADPVPWRWWLGEGHPSRTVTLAATATEWTPLALGRVVSLISEACRHTGLTRHVGVRVVRADPR